MSTADWLLAIGRSEFPDGWRLESVGSRYDVQLGKMLNADNAAEPGEPGAAPYLRNVNVQWDRIDTAHLYWMRFSPEDRTKYALRRGDLLVCEGGEIGRCAIWQSDRDDCFFQKALMRVRPRGVDDVAWLALCLRALADGGVLSAGADGSTIDHLPAEKLRSLRVPLPSPGIQREVLYALDVETARVDEMVMARTRQASLLEERAAAVRDRAIAAAGKPTRLSNALASIEQGWSPECDARVPDRDEWGVLKAGATNYGVFRAAESKALPAALAPRPHFEVRTGDVLMSRANTRELAGSAAFVEECRQRLMFSDKLYRISPDQAKLRPRYLTLVLQSAQARARIEAETVGSSSSMQNISQQLVRDLRLPIPSLDEQARIVGVCDGAVARARAAIDAIERQIALLRERRQALITAAVTGKLRVSLATTRNAAA